MLICDNPPPITVVLDPGDDLVHTRAALAAHAPADGGDDFPHVPGPVVGEVPLVADVVEGVVDPEELVRFVRVPVVYESGGVGRFDGQAAPGVEVILGLSAED